jgi:hypothetical protein
MFASLAEPLRSLRTWSLSMQVAGFISGLQENAFSTYQFNSSLSPVCMHVPLPQVTSHLTVDLHANLA